MSNSFIVLSKLSLTFGLTHFIARDYIYTSRLYSYLETIYIPRDYMYTLKVYIYLEGIYRSSRDYLYTLRLETKSLKTSSWLLIFTSQISFQFAFSLQLLIPFYIHIEPMAYMINFAEANPKPQKFEILNCKSVSMLFVIS